MHDTFNFLTVLVLLPLELVTHYFEVVSEKIIKLINFDTSIKEPELLNALTKPLTKKIIQLDKNTLDLIAKNQTKGGETLIKHICMKKSVYEVDELEVNISSTVVEKCKLTIAA